MIAHLKPLVIDLEALMNVKDANIIYRMIREKYPPDVLPARVMTQIIEVLLEYFASIDSEGDKGQVLIQPERTNPKDALSVCDVPTSDYM